MYTVTDRQVEAVEVLRSRNGRQQIWTNRPTDRRKQYLLCSVEHSWRAANNSNKLECVMQIFMKVDTNCDGTVDWNEYVSFMLLEEQRRQAMNFDAERRCLPTKLVRRVKPGRKSPSYDHSDNVVRIVFQPATLRDGNIFKVEVHPIPFP